MLSTGTDTKINFGGDGRSEPKRGHAVELINKDIMGTCILLVVCCVIGSTTNALLRDSFRGGEPWYLGADGAGSATFGEWIISGGSFFLLIYGLIPISLYVSMGMVRVITKGLICSDISMYDAEGDELCQAPLDT